MTGIAVFLCSKTPIMALPWAEAGIECYCVDVQHSIRKPVRDGNINFVWGDCRTWEPPAGKRIIFGFGFPPCTNDAGSGARDFLLKGPMLLADSIELFTACRQAFRWAGCPYGLEHPVTVLSKIPHIGKWNFTFDPCDYGLYPGGENDAYTKRTCIWTGNGFVEPEKRRIEPVEGSRMHLMTPSDDRADRRAETPKGFSRAVFEANFKLVTDRLQPVESHQTDRLKPDTSACTDRLQPAGAAA